MMTLQQIETQAENGRYNRIQVLNYESLLSQIEEALSLDKDPTIATDQDLKAAKARRAEIGKAQKAVRSRRIATDKDACGVWDEQCKTIERLLDEAFKGYSKAIDSYLGKEEVESVTFTISVEKDKAQAIRDLLSANHIEYKEK